MNENRVKRNRLLGEKIVKGLESRNMDGQLKALWYPTVQVEYFHEDGGRNGKEKEAALQKE